MLLPPSAPEAPLLLSAALVALPIPFPPLCILLEEEDPPLMLL
jgi:hypothetical protein